MDHRLSDTLSGGFNHAFAGLWAILGPKQPPCLLRAPVQGTAPASGSELCCTQVPVLQGHTCLTPPIPAPGTKCSGNYLRNKVQMHPVDPALGSRAQESTWPANCPGDPSSLFRGRGVQNTLNVSPSCASCPAAVFVSHPLSRPPLPAVRSGNLSCVFKTQLPRVQNLYFSPLFLQGEQSRMCPDTGSALPQVSAGCSF